MGKDLESAEAIDVAEQSEVVLVGMIEVTDHLLVLVI